MKIKYKYITGEVAEVEVSDEIGIEILIKLGQILREIENIKKGLDLGTANPSSSVSSSSSSSIFSLTSLMISFHLIFRRFNSAFWYWLSFGHLSVCVSFTPSLCCVVIARERKLHAYAYYSLPITVFYFPLALRIYLYIGITSLCL